MNNSVDAFDNTSLQSGVSDSEKSNASPKKRFRIWFRCQFCHYRTEMYIDADAGIGCCPLCGLDASSPPAEEELAAALAAAKERMALLEALLPIIND